MAKTIDGERVRDEITAFNEILKTLGRRFEELHPSALRVVYGVIRRARKSIETVLDTSGIVASSEALEVVNPTEQLRRTLNSCVDILPISNTTLKARIIGFYSGYPGHPPPKICTIVRLEGNRLKLIVGQNGIGDTSVHVVEQALKQILPMDRDLTAEEIAEFVGMMMM